MLFAKNLQEDPQKARYSRCIRKKIPFYRLTAGDFVAIIVKLYDSLAQLAEHLIFNQGVRSSNLRWVTKRVRNALYAGVAQLVEQLICNQQVRGSSPFTSSTDKEVEGVCLSSFIHPRVWKRTQTLRGFCRLENLPAADFQTKTARGAAVPRAVETREAWLRPFTSSINGGVPEWPKGADCKSVASRFGGSNPPSSTKKATDLSVAFLMKFVLRTSEIASL